MARKAQMAPARRSAWPRLPLPRLHWPRLPLPDGYTCFSLLLALALCSLVGVMLLQARQDAWDRARQETGNMRRLVMRDVARNLEVIDLSLRAIDDNLAVPGVVELPPHIRDMVLFDRAITASHIGAVFATDETGTVVHTPGTIWDGPAASFVDRDYFQAHRDHPDVGLFISRPEVGRLTGAWRIMLSRRRNNPDGSFAGVVAAGVQLSYFRELFSGLSLGPNSVVALLRTDGTLLFRTPWRESALGSNLAAGPAFAQINAGHAQAFVAFSLMDGVERLFASGPVGTHPLRVLVGVQTTHIEAAWRRTALVEAVATLLLAGGVVALTLVWRRNMRQRAAAEAAALASEARFRMLAENSGDMVSRLSLDLTRLYASPAARRVIGQSQEAAVGHRTVEDIHPEDRAAVEAAMARLRHGEAEETSVTYRVLRPNAAAGAESWVEGIVRVTHDPATGKPDGYVAVSRDISERHRQETERAARAAELAEARDAAEAASRAKSRFLSSMSHELRTPLNVILGFAQVLSLDEGLRATQKQQLGAMQAAGRHLLEMISGILDFSRIEAGQTDLNPMLCVLQPLAAQCVEMVRPTGEAKGLALALEVAPDAPATAVLDPLRLRQILINLLGNAVKFTDQGSVVLRLLPGAPGHLRLEVADTGTGIPPDQRGRLFQDFERLGEGGAGTAQGSGLGLAISSRLAVLMGGRMAHAENPGGGSLFWLELPLRQAEQLAPPQPATA